MRRFLDLPRGQQDRLYINWAIGFLILAKLSGPMLSFMNRAIPSNSLHRNDPLQEAREFHANRHLNRLQFQIEIFLLFIGGLGLAGFVLNEVRHGRDDNPNPVPAPPPPPEPPLQNVETEPDYEKCMSYWFALWGVIGSVISLPYFDSEYRKIREDCEREECTPDEEERRIHELDVQTTLSSQVAYHVGFLGALYFRRLSQHPEDAPAFIAQLAPRRPRMRRDHQE